MTTQLERDIAALLRRERMAAGLTQERLARAIGISQSRLSRYETMKAFRPRLDVLGRAFAVLQVHVEIEPRRPIGERQRDRGHAFVLAYLLRRVPTGWLSDSEVTVRQGRRRGWLDLLLYHPGSRILLVLEIKTEIHDVGETLRTLRWHAERALPAALERGWRPRVVIPVLVVLATTEATERLVAARPVIAAALPGDARGLADLLAIGASAARTDVSESSRADACERGYVAMVDPSSRKADWLGPIPKRGRRPRTRWSGYAEFMRFAAARPIRRPPSSNRRPPSSAGRPPSVGRPPSPTRRP